MLIAVVQEIKKRFPEAQVFENDIRPDVELLRQQFGDNYRLLGAMPCRDSSRNSNWRSMLTFS